MIKNLHREKCVWKCILSWFVKESYPKRLNKCYFEKKWHFNNVFTLQVRYYACESLYNVVKVIFYNFLFCHFSVNFYYHYINEVVLSACLSICLSDHNSGTLGLDRFASNFDWRTRETHGNVLSYVFKV